MPSRINVRKEIEAAITLIETTKDPVVKERHINLLRQLASGCCRELKQDALILLARSLCDIWDFNCNQADSKN